MLNLTVVMISSWPTRLNGSLPAAIDLQKCVQVTFTLMKVCAVLDNNFFSNQS